MANRAFDALAAPNLRQRPAERSPAPAPVPAPPPAAREVWGGETDVPAGAYVARQQPSRPRPQLVDSTVLDAGLGQASLASIPAGTALKPSEKALVMADLYARWAASPAEARAALERVGEGKLGFDPNNPSLTDEQVSRAARSLSVMWREMSSSLDVIRQPR